MSVEPSPSEDGSVFEDTKGGLRSLDSPHDLVQIKADDDLESSEEIGTQKRHSRSLMGSFSKRKKKGGKFKTSLSVEEGEDCLERQGSMGRGTIHYSRIARQKKTMKLSRALSDLVKYTKSVGIHDVESEISCSWQVSSFSETKAHQVIQQKPAQYIRFNQSQLSRIYPSSYRVDSSNYNPQPFWNEGCQMVALNYQSEGRMLQLNRAKFSANGNCGYVLKPKCMCQGGFNPNSDDPLPGQLKKQLVLRIISGQQLPKPKDSMLGDRGEIIDPFVEVEIIGLPVDCLKEQTRVVDDNGFNPMWEETLVFTVHMPEITLIRFLVWDHDPIGRDFIGQRTIAFSSMMPGYRHVYLEGMEEASVFVHVAINEVSGKAKQVMGLKGLFHRNPKQASLDSHAVGHLHRKHSFSSHILRRTASAPTKGQLKNKKGFPEIAIDTKDNSSEGASEDRELDDSSLPRFDTESESAFPGPTPGDSVNGEPSLQGKGLKGKAYCCGKGKSPTRFQAGLTFSDPIRRSERVRLREPPNERPGVFARCAMNGSGRIGMATNCMKCMIGSKESPDLECKWSESASWPIAKDVPQNEQYRNKAGEERIEMKCYSVTDQPRRQPPDLLPYRSCENTEDLPKNAQSSVAPAKKNGDSKCLGGKANNRPKWQCQSGGRYGSTVNLVTAGNGSISSNSSSLESLGSPEFSTRWPENSRRQASTLQREMNALFVQKLEEIRSKSPIFFAGIHQYPILKSVSSLCSLETITEEPTTAKGKTCTGLCLAPPVCPTWGPRQGSPSSRCKVTRAECTSPFRQLDDLPSASNGPIGLASMVEVKSPNPTTLEMPIGLECNNRIEGHATDRNGNLLPHNDSIEKSNSIVHTQAILDNSAPAEAPQDCKVEAQTDKVTMRVKNISQPSNEKLNAMHEQPQHNSLQLNRPLLQAAHINPTTKGPIAHQCLSQNGPRMLVRRSKSEGHVTSATMLDDGCQSPEAEVYYDATVNDQIWSKLDAGNHRDSMSSSSSMSSNDTVIDISLPNLARKSLPDLESSHLENFDSILVKNGMRPRSATTSGEEMLMVSKSKSNPNLKCNQPRTDELRPRPLAKGDEGSVPPMMTRRHTWSRLYMESLKQSSSKVRVVEDKSSTNQTKSKSLGDLTSDDISCNFESKYRSISRSFLPHSLRAQRQPPHTRSPTKPQDDLTEQLRKLTSFQQENDITSPTGFVPAESEEDGLFLLRRTSSRSQSRVRYIANRAKQAQERQRLQSLSQVNGTPIEERGNPEGACSVSKGTCTDSVSSPALGTQAKSEGDLIRGTDVFFMLKL